ncbi:hypothetical protein [Hydrogenophaga sp.]
MVVRLGLSLVLSLGLAVVLAWGWNHSDQIAVTQPEVVSTAPSNAPQH